jgi:hypothetical protein
MTFTSWLRRHSVLISFADILAAAMLRICWRTNQQTNSWVGELWSSPRVYTTEVARRNRSSMWGDSVEWPAGGSQ